MRSKELFLQLIYMKSLISTIPKSSESRHDIIQAVELGSPEAMKAFCLGIQEAAPVDSYAVPETVGHAGLRRGSNHGCGNVCAGIFDRT